MLRSTSIVVFAAALAVAGCAKKQEAQSTGSLLSGSSSDSEDEESERREREMGPQGPDSSSGPGRRIPR